MVAYRLEGPKWTTTPITSSFAGYNYINKYRYDQSPYLSLPIRPDGEILMADRWYSPPSTGATVSVVRVTYSRSRFSVGTTGIHAYDTTKGLIPAGKKIYLEFPSTCNNNDTTNLVWGMTSATRSGFRGSAISGAGNVYWTAVPNHLTINGVSITPLPRDFGVWTLGAAIDTINMRLWLKGIAGTSGGTAYAWNSTALAPGTADPATNVGGYDISMLTFPLVCFAYTATTGACVWDYQSLPPFYAPVPAGFSGYDPLGGKGNVMAQILS